MTSAELLKVGHGGPFSGRFRLRSPQSCMARDGRAYARMDLEDMNGRIPAFIWCPENESQLPPDLSCVQVDGVVRWRRDGAVADLERVKAADKQPEEVIRMIPQSICPQPWLMAFLEALVQRLQTTWLKQFVVDVLWDDAIAFPFVACPASLQYHHNYPGGLLHHSIECAQMLARYDEFSLEQKELGIVAALFHDIAKTVTMTPQMRRTTLGKAVDHDKMTLEVLAPYLRPYDKDWPNETAELLYLMTWRPANRDRGIPRTPLANAVLAADRISAGIDCR